MDEVNRMKINDTQRAHSVNVYRRAQGTVASGGTGSKGKIDEVQISSEAKRLLGAQNSEEHLKRIEDLKQSVSTGTYHVDAGKIADKLLPYLK
jgi:negative regulator of flagellin synthesis FlgM